MSENSDPMAELKAMSAFAEAVAGLDAEAIGRVLRWAVDHYKVSVTVPKAQRAPGVPAVENGGLDNGQTLEFAELHELYNAASPEYDADKVLVAGYFYQFCQGKPELTAQEINSGLKDLGYPIKNITSAFENLKARKPAHVAQVRKAGSTRQARKTYKLTLAGKRAVEMMVGHSA